MPPRQAIPSFEETIANTNQSLETNNQLITTLLENMNKLVVSSQATNDKIDALTLAINTQATNTNNHIDALAKQIIQPPPSMGSNQSTSSSTMHDTNQNSPPPPPLLSNTTLKSPKIQLPSFNGTNPLDWLFQADQYFTFYNIPPAQRIALSSFHFQGEALSWFKYLHNNRLLGDWPQFTRALELRFGPSTFENHQAVLFKLEQTTTVAAYQTKFERVSNCVTGLSHDALLNCFISGLRPDIQRELATLHPTTLHQTYGLAKLIEDKLAAGHTLPSSTDKTPPYTPTSTTIVSSSSVTPLLPPPTTTNTTIPVRRLTPAEMQARRSQGLCFRCSEKFHPGHRCNPPQFLLLETSEDLPSASSNLEDKVDFQPAGIDTGQYRFV